MGTRLIRQGKTILLKCGTTGCPYEEWKMENAFLSYLKQKSIPDGFMT